MWSALADFWHHHCNQNSFYAFAAIRMVPEICSWAVCACVLYQKFVNTTSYKPLVGILADLRFVAVGQKKMSWLDFEVKRSKVRVTVYVWDDIWSSSTVGDIFSPSFRISGHILVNYHSYLLPGPHVTDDISSREFKG